MDRRSLDRRSLERAASTDPAVRDALKAVHRRVSFMKTQTQQLGGAAAASGRRGTARASARRKTPSNEELAPYACRRCNACTAVANGVAEVVGTSLANCPWVIAKFRMQRQVDAHESGYAKGDPEPDPRKESTYAHLCRSGFLGATKPDTARLPPDTQRTARTLHTMHQRGTYQRGHHDWAHWDPLIKPVDKERSGNNVYKVGDTLMPHEYKAQEQYVQDLRWKLEDESSHGNIYNMDNMLEPWKASTQDKAHWLRGRADGSLSPFRRLEGLK